MRTPHARRHVGRSAGFTIVELLIVIVVIAILVAITIAIFGGIQRRASVSALTSDLKQAASQLGVFNVTNGKYPATETEANGGQGLSKSSGTSYQYTYTSATNAYCLTAVSSKSGIPAYYISNTVSTPTEGVCAGHAGPIAESQQITVSTFAGDGGGAFRDGARSTSQFYNPGGVLVDGAGAVYIGDTNNARVRKITGDTVSTVAGSAMSGYAPRGMVFDTAGNLYFADSSADVIRKMTTAGSVTIFAGTGTSGFANGAATSAQFNDPYDLTLDSSGNMYVADYGNGLIRKITPAGTVSTHVGAYPHFGGYVGGDLSTARLRNPIGISTDSNGNMYVADSQLNRIIKIATDGTVSSFAGTGVAGFADGPGASSQFNYPAGIAVDTSGNVYVAEYSGNRVRKITSSGSVSTVAGTGVAGFADGPGASAQFNNPIALDVDSSGNLYVADFWGHRIRKITQQ